MDPSSVEVAMKEAWQAWNHESVRAPLDRSPEKKSSTGTRTGIPASSGGDRDIQQVQQAHIRDHDTYIEPTATTMRQQSLCGSTVSSVSSKKLFETIEAPKPTYTPDSHKSTATTTTPNNLSMPALNNQTAVGQISFSYKTADPADLAASTTAHPLPAQVSPKWWCDVRYIWFSTYRRLYGLVILTNIAVVAAMIARERKRPGSFTYCSAATATGANLLMAALARHEHCINVLFRIVCLLPQSTPLCIRRYAAKVYSYGGIHSGCGVSAFLWYIFYSVLLVKQIGGPDPASLALVVTTALTLVLLFTIIAMAHPYIRSHWHNQWELSHRYAGWTAIALVWAQTLITVITAAHKASDPIGLTLATTPTFWFLLLITFLLIYPWIRLRRRPVVAEKLSAHATRLHFNDRTLPTCVAYRLSHNPVRENHGFATIPNAPDEEKGYSIVVSNAGDFTRNLINNPPTHVWTRGAPTTGVMRIATLFRPIVIVATGSGIGPCLSFLNVYGAEYPLRIIWSARSPEETYGRDIMRTVLKSDKTAILIDTKKTGHPDLNALSYALYKSIGAEAVVVISNPKVTRDVVFALECRGVPAFAPIFDS